jgi:hypothetical protein
MNQRGVILAVVTVGLVAAALWYWRGSAEPTDVAMTPAKDTASMQSAFHGSSTGPAPAEPAPASGSTVSATAAPASEVVPPPVAAPTEPPQSVDTPEPAQRKFARGGKPDESEQN